MICVANRISRVDQYSIYEIQLLAPMQRTEHATQSCSLPSGHLDLVSVSDNPHIVVHDSLSKLSPKLIEQLLLVQPLCRQTLHVAADRLPKPVGADLEEQLRAHLSIFHETTLCAQNQQG